VLYNGAADASRIPPEWHAWLHFITPEPPSTAPLPVKPWEREHLPNLTGTPDAHRPPGSLAGQPVRSAVSGGYQAWRPDA
jgi:NADH:ubiquinone oxidoreductase subunit